MDKVSQCPQRPRRYPPLSLSALLLFRSTFHLQHLSFLKAVSKRRKCVSVCFRESAWWGE